MKRMRQTMNHPRRMSHMEVGESHVYWSHAVNQVTGYSSEDVFQSGMLEWLNQVWHAGLHAGL